MSVGEMHDFAIADFNTEICSAATFSFTANGGALPSFLTASGSTLSSSPTSNEEAGTYTLDASIAHDSSSEVVSSFSLTVNQLAASSSGSSSTTTSLGNSGITV